MEEKDTGSSIGTEMNAESALQYICSLVSHTSGYFGSFCATLFGVIVPGISV